MAALLTSTHGDRQNDATSANDPVSFLWLSDWLSASEPDRIRQPNLAIFLRILEPARGLEPRTC
jgi:hypothetical protein